MVSFAACGNNLREIPEDQNSGNNISFGLGNDSSASQQNDNQANFFVGSMGFGKE